MHKKFEINGTKIEVGCQSGRKVVTHKPKSELPLKKFLRARNCARARNMSYPRLELKSTENRWNVPLEWFSEARRKYLYNFFPLSIDLTNVSLNTLSKCKYVCIYVLTLQSFYIVHTLYKYHSEKKQNSWTTYNARAVFFNGD